MASLLSFLLAVTLLVAVNEYSHYRVEVAVEAFLQRQIRFDQIHRVNRSTLDRVVFDAPRNLDDLLALDAHARRAAREVIQSLDPR